MSIVEKSWYVTGATGIALMTLARLASACSNGHSDPSIGDSSAEVANTEADLNAAKGSLAMAQSEAQACFDTYRTCEQAAGASSDSCRAALKDCLPAQAPAPASCGDAGGVKPPREHDGGPALTLRPMMDRDGGAHMRGPGEPDDRGDRGRDDHDEHGDRDPGRACDGGPDPRQDHGPKLRADGGFPGASAPDHADACRPIGVADDAMGSCRDHAAADLAHGRDPAAAADAHKQCVTSSFESRISELCQKAGELCATPGAPADACARITTACSATGSQT